jgi:hypothetical protein
MAAGTRNKSTLSALIAKTTHHTIPPPGMSKKDTTPRVQELTRRPPRTSMEILIALAAENSRQRPEIGVTVNPAEMSFRE